MHHVITGRQAMYPSGPIGDDTWVYSPDRMTRACVTYAGDGIDGNYEETDPTDIALMRVNVVVRPDSSWAGIEGPEGDEWRWPKGGGTIATHIRRDHVTPRQRGLLGASVAHRASLAFGQDEAFRDLLDHVSRWTETSADDYSDMRLRMQMQDA